MQEKNDLNAISSLPLQGVYQVPHIVGDEIYYRLKRVVIGINIEIKRASHEMIGAVGKVELQRRCHTLAVEEINQAVHPSVAVYHNAVTYAGGLGDVFGYHSVGILQILTQVVIDSLI